MRRTQMNAGAVIAVAIVGWLWLDYQHGRQQADAAADNFVTLAAAVNHLASQQVVVTDRVVELPEDAAAWHLTIVWPSESWKDDPLSRRVAGWFATEPQLVTLRAQVQNHEYTPEDKLYAARFAPTFGTDLPAIRVQQAVDPATNKAAVCYEAKASDLSGMTGAQLADEIATAIEQCGPRPKPQPQPQPQPGPNLVPSIRPINPPAAPDGGSTLAFILAALAAGGFGLYQDFKQETSA